MLLVSIVVLLVQDNDYSTFLSVFVGRGLCDGWLFAAFR